MDLKDLEILRLSDPLSSIDQSINRSFTHVASSELKSS